MDKTMLTSLLQAEAYMRDQAGVSPPLSFVSIDHIMHVAFWEFKARQHG